MTIIAEQAQEPRAKRRIIAQFRLEGGPLPRRIPEDLLIDPKGQEDQNTTGYRDYSSAHLCKLRLPIPL